MNGTSRVYFSLFASLVLTACGANSASSPSIGVENSLLEGESQVNDTNFVDPTNPLGFYSNGSITAASRLPDVSPGLIKIFRLRNRGYATETLLRTLSTAARTVNAAYPSGERLQVADITDVNGGTLSGHASHQNGQDADVIYLRMNHFEENPDTNGPHGFTETFVKGSKVTANFDVARNWAVFKSLVAQGTVNRIFVDPAIKNALCAQSSKVDPGASAAVRTETLRRIRPYANHDDHFHMRVNCPPNHSKCQAQAAPPSGSGCTSVASLTDDTALREDRQEEDELGADEL